jgi:hypothetical protein
MTFDEALFVFAEHIAAHEYGTKHNNEAEEV